MSLKTVLRSLSIYSIMILLTGCVTPVVRTQESDQAIKSVAVVSLLNESTRVNKIGITVFNNKAAIVDQSGILNNLAIDTVEGALRVARPNWVLKNVRGEVKGLIEKKIAAGISWSSGTSSITKDLAELSKSMDADLLFVMVDTRLDNLPYHGVGVRLRATSNDSVSDAVVHAMCSLVLVGRDGREITNRWGGNQAYMTIPISQLGLDKDPKALDSAEGQDRLRQLMQERLQAALLSSVKSMGY